MHKCCTIFIDMENNISLIYTVNICQNTKIVADVVVNKEQNFEVIFTIAWTILYGVICVPATLGNILLLLCLSRFKD